MDRETEGQSGKETVKIRVMELVIGKMLPRLRESLELIAIQFTHISEQS